MGYMQHHAILVSSWNEEDIKKIHEKASDIFGEEVSELVESGVNGYVTFFVAPDGSKEGWEESKKGDERRDRFIEYLSGNKLYCDYAEIYFGDDEGMAGVLRHN